MTTVTTSIDPATGGVTVSWTAPTDTGGLTLTKYLIEVFDSSGSWVEDAACDGSDSTIFAALSCTIPMENLVNTHTLTFDTLVVFRASAFNAIGAGATSDPNTDGARIR